VGASSASSAELPSGAAAEPQLAGLARFHCSVSPRLTGTLLCALALCLALPSVAFAARSPARVKVVDCDVANTPAQSVASFEGRMREVPGTARMSMRFTLLERFGTPRFEPVRVPELAIWRTSKAGVEVFSYTQRVRALERGGDYRMRVEFRWQDSRGRTIRSARRSSGLCGRPGPLPQLQIADVRARPGAAAGTMEYAVDVSNLGDLEAEEVPVLLVVDGAALDVREIDSLAPGETATVRFSGPRCTHRLRTEVDPEDDIHESREDDNRRDVRCFDPPPPDGLLG
jgi:hypothetical protein